MRYCIISDIHSNLEALKAVLDDARKEKIDAYLCAGDIIGYATDPRECIALVRALEPKVLIAGNHEWGVLGLLDLEYFNEYAKAAIVWTRTAIGEDDVAYLRSFQLAYEAEGFTMVHGTLDRPAEFYYIFDKDDAYATAALMKTAVCFVGHSHIAGIYYSEEGGMRSVSGTKTVIGKDRRYVVNVGSIGQPRDRDVRSAYAIFDEDERTVEIRRVAYDIRAVQRKILDAGLPAWLAARLSEGR